MEIKGISHVFFYLKDGSTVEVTAYKSQMTKEVALPSLALHDA